ncbi:MAG TPA: ubiquitin-like domain-containing protein [Acidimicrobiia bacterium]
MRPSPARVAAPEPEVWLPITDLGEVLELEVELWASELLDDTAGSVPGGPSPSGNVTLLPPPEVEGAPDADVDAPLQARELVEPTVAPPLVAPTSPAPSLPAPTPASPTTPATRPVPARAPLPRRLPVPTTAPAPAAPRRRTHPQAPARPGVGQAVVLTATVAAVAVGAMFLLGAKAHRVTVEVDGRSFTRSSDAATVADLLRDQHLALGPHDVVAPGRTTRLKDGLLIQVVHDAVSDPPLPPARAPGGGVPFGEATGAATPPAPTPTTAAPVVATPPPTAASRPRSTPPSTVQHRQTPTFSHNHHAARGGASWYASPFGSDSCASRALPRGTIVSIVNLDNGRSATCRVADYGPVARSRVLDLDNDVFRRLSPLGIGVIPVAISW